jgi:hypothetical protein
MLAPLLIRLGSRRILPIICLYCSRRVESSGCTHSVLSHELDPGICGDASPYGSTFCRRFRGLAGGGRIASRVGGRENRRLPDIFLDPGLHDDINHIVPGTLGEFSYADNRPHGYLSVLWKFGSAGMFLINPRSTSVEREHAAPYRDYVLLILFNSSSSLSPLHVGGWKHARYPSESCRRSSHS